MAATMMTPSLQKDCAGDTDGEVHVQDPCPPWHVLAIQDMLYRSTNPDGTPLRPAHIAAMLGCSVNLLYAWATDPLNPSAKHLHPHAHRIVPLTLATQNYAWLDALEDKVGRVAFPKETASDLPLSQQTTAVLLKAAELVQAFNKTVNDGQIAAEEVERVIPIIDALFQQLRQLKTDCQLRKAVEAGS